MPARLAVDEANQLQPFGQSEFPQQPATLRIAAKIISYIFHPVFIPVYVVAFLLYMHPYLFAGFSKWNKSITLIQAFVMFTFFPLVTVFLLKALKFINSLYLQTQKDRIIPLVASNIWYFWIWWVWHNLPDYPSASVQFALAIFIAASLAWIANIFLKISLHAISMGVVIAFFFQLALSEDISYGIYLSVVLLIAGIVCTSRFIISDHSPQEVYSGLFVGVISQLVAGWLG